MFYDYAIEYGFFVAKWLTVLISLALVLLLIVALSLRARTQTSERLEITHLNDKYKSMELSLQGQLLPAKAFKQRLKEHKKSQKERAKSAPEATPRKRVFVCRFKGDIRASGVKRLREEITAALSVARPEDEVVALLESAGGTIHDYGLAASQLARVREHSIPLTICIDVVAASGGYMMACVADRILAAPFAIVGSIGVIGQLPNFHRLLKKHDIDFEQITAGRYKRTLTIFGENTDADREKFEKDLIAAHDLFKNFVRKYRPSLDIESVATGEHWFGTEALEKNLIDEVQTSDEYLTTSARNADIYELKYIDKKSWLERTLSHTAETNNIEHRELLKHFAPPRQ